MPSTARIMALALLREQLCRTTKGALMDVLQEDRRISRNKAREIANAVIRVARRRHGGDLRRAQ